MSDPVTNVDIEDVLSSIRKLVSEGERARTRDSVEAEPGADDDTSEAESKPDRLVLTPAFRVSEPAPDAGADQDDGSIEAETATEPAANANQPQTAPMPSDQAAVDRSGVETPDGSWPELSDDTAAVESEWGETRWNDDDIAAEAALEGWSEDPGSGDRTEAEAVAATVPADRQTAEPDDGIATEEALVERDEPAEGSSRLTRLEATIAELEAAVGAEAEEFEPDGSEESAPETAFDWPAATRPAPPVEVEMESEIEAARDAAAAEREAPGSATEPEPLQAPEVELASTAAAPAIDDDLEDWDHLGSTIDDERLREIVAEIVREELQGSLGERITRNVRKLVRREIYRILASQDFD